MNEFYAINLTIYFVISLLFNLIIWNISNPILNVKQYRCLRKIQLEKYRPKKCYLYKKCFSTRLCLKIIQEAENKAKILNGWKKINYHSYLNRKFLDISLGWKCSDDIIDNVYDLIVPQYNKIFHTTFNSRLISIGKIMVIKLDSNNINLEWFKSNYPFNFIVALNDNYVGGGTEFKNINIYNPDKKKLRMGDCLIFSGYENHRDLKNTSGIRYILYGILKIDLNCNKENCMCFENFCEKSSFLEEELATFCLHEKNNFRSYIKN
tara:strand:- start:27773 stop:28567 length:795 start_codon:yes stop_codon:yes gene_type:complete